MSTKLTLEEFCHEPSGEFYLSYEEMASRGIKPLDVSYLIGRKSRQIGRGLFSKQRPSSDGITFSWQPIPYPKIDAVN